jgi:hypothetical protein
LATEGKTLQDTGEECITWSFMNRFIPRQKYYVNQIKEDSKSVEQKRIAYRVLAGKPERK